MSRPGSPGDFAVQGEESSCYKRSLQYALFFARPILRLSVIALSERGFAALRTTTLYVRIPVAIGAYGFIVGMGLASRYKYIGKQKPVSRPDNIAEAIAFYLLKGLYMLSSLAILLLGVIGPADSAQFFTSAILSTTHLDHRQQQAYAGLAHDIGLGIGGVVGVISMLIFLAFKSHNSLDNIRYVAKGSRLVGWPIFIGILLESTFVASAYASFNFFLFRSGIDKVATFLKKYIAHGLYISKVPTYATYAAYGAMPLGFFCVYPLYTGNRIKAHSKKDSLFKLNGCSAQSAIVLVYGLAAIWEYFCSTSEIALHFTKKNDFFELPVQDYSFWLSVGSCFLMGICGMLYSMAINVHHAFATRRVNAERVDVEANGDPDAGATAPLLQ